MDRSGAIASSPTDARDRVPVYARGPRVGSGAQADYPPGVAEWDPGQYARFEAERSRPFFDLLALVEPRAGMRVVDLGCGTGKLTAELHHRLGAAETIGIDSSEAMLAQSAAQAGPSLRFERADIETWSPSSALDLVFANASLHWIDGHPALLARLASWLSPGGQLAVQMPANDVHPAYRAAADVALQDPFSSALGGWVRALPNLAIEDYSVALARLGFVDPHVRTQVYLHRLASRDEVLEWTRGALLTAYLERLPRELHEPFLARYREVLRARLPDERPYLFTFRRILFHGARPR